MLLRSVWSCWRSLWTSSCRERLSNLVQLCPPSISHLTDICNKYRLYSVPFPERKKLEGSPCRRDVLSWHSILLVFYEGLLEGKCNSETQKIFSHWIGTMDCSLLKVFIVKNTSFPDATVLSHQSVIWGWGRRVLSLNVHVPKESRCSGYTEQEWWIDGGNSCVAQ